MKRPKLPPGWRYTGEYRTPLMGEWYAIQGDLVLVGQCTRKTIARKRWIVERER